MAEVIERKLKAKLVIHGKHNLEQRRAIAKWLRSVAKFYASKGNEFSKRYTARLWWT